VIDFRIPKIAKLKQLPKFPGMWYDIKKYKHMHHAHRNCVVVRGLLCIGD